MSRSVAYFSIGQLAVIQIDETGSRLVHFADPP
jgi:hypothetical protein